MLREDAEDFQAADNVLAPTRQRANSWLLCFYTRL